MNKKWKPKIEEDKINWFDSINDKLSLVHNIEKDNLKEFLNPTEKSIYPTKLLLNIKPFVMRMVKAFKEGERIVVVGDVDY